MCSSDSTVTSILVQRTFVPSEDIPNGKRYVSEWNTILWKIWNLLRCSFCGGGGERAHSRWQRRGLLLLFFLSIYAFIYTRICNRKMKYKACLYYSIPADSIWYFQKLSLSRSFVLWKHESVSMTFIWACHRSWKFLDRLGLIQRKIGIVRALRYPDSLLMTVWCPLRNMLVHWQRRMLTFFLTPRKGRVSLKPEACCCVTFLGLICRLWCNTPYFIIPSPNFHGEGPSDTAGRPSAVTDRKRTNWVILWGWVLLQRPKSLVLFISFVNPGVIPGGFFLSCSVDE